MIPMSKNLAAFLVTIQHSEGVDNVKDVNGVLVDPYRVCYAKRHVIQDLSWHPAEHHPDDTREWGGDRITQGIYTGELSTAAGAYQLILPTWLGCKRILRLTNFEKDAQDSSAIELMREKNALSLVEAGQFVDALTACRSLWASFPGGNSGQKQQLVADLVSKYVNSGGAFA